MVFQDPPMLRQGPRKPDRNLGPALCSVGESGIPGGVEEQLTVAVPVAIIKVIVLVVVVLLLLLLLLLLPQATHKSGRKFLSGFLRPWCSMGGSWNAIRCSRTAGSS